MTPEQITELVAQNPTTFETFYNVYSDRFFRYTKARTYLKDSQINDAIWDTFYQLRLYLPKLQDIKKFESYIRTTLRSRVATYFTNKEQALWDIDVSDDDESWMHNDFELEVIQQAMQQLDSTTRDIIHFRYIEELDYEDIETIVWLSSQNVRQKLSRWLKKLKTILVR